MLVYQNLPLWDPGIKLESWCKSAEYCVLREHLASPPDSAVACSLKLSSFILGSSSFQVLLAWFGSLGLNAESLSEHSLFQSAVLARTVPDTCHASRYGPGEPGWGWRLGVLTSAPVVFLEASRCHQMVLPISNEPWALCCLITLCYLVFGVNFTFTNSSSGRWGVERRTSFLWEKMNMVHFEPWAKHFSNEFQTFLMDLVWCLSFTVTWGFFHEVQNSALMCGMQVWPALL